MWLFNDRNEGAKWGGEYNQGDYQAVQTFQMNPGDEVGLMLIQNTTAQDIYENPSRIYQWGKTPLFSMPEANIGGNLTQASNSHYGNFARTIALKIQSRLRKKRSLREDFCNSKKLLVKMRIAELKQ